MRLALKLRGSILLLLALLTATLPCFAGEVAVLRNGFSIRHERREIIGDTTRLYVTADGSSFVDVPTAEIEHFEAAPELPAPDPRPGIPLETKSPLLANYARNGTPGSRGSAPSSSLNLDEVVNSASQRYWLDPDLVSSVIKAESGLQPASGVSERRARADAVDAGDRVELGVPNAFDPEANVEGGTKYLRELLERYNFDLVKALAAYNAGPLRVEQFGGVPPYYETRAYVARVVTDFNKKKLPRKLRGRPLPPGNPMPTLRREQRSLRHGDQASAEQERE